MFLMQAFQNTNSYSRHLLGWWSKQNKSPKTDVPLYDLVDPKDTDPEADAPCAAPTPTPSVRIAAKGCIQMEGESVCVSLQREVLYIPQYSDPKQQLNQRAYGLVLIWS